MTRTINNFREREGEALGFACQLFGVDRQVYYRAVRRGRCKMDIAGQVAAMVGDIRQAMPRVGSRKLYHLLNDELKALKVGRDKFIAILGANHLLIKPKRQYHVTTNSHHRFRKHENLIMGLMIHRPEQVWTVRRCGFGHHLYR